MTRLLGHAQEEKFPTRFDRCNASGLRKMLAPWSSVTITPYYRGATYLGFSRLLQRAYLGYESQLERRHKENLATHYLIVAEK